jgi:hypothetical protein
MFSDSIIDKSGSIIDGSRSIIGDSRSKIDDRKCHFKLWHHLLTTLDVSFAMVIFFMTQATNLKTEQI